jgi:hypothetical protein
MDNLLEILIPLIFAAFYFFGNVFSGKEEDTSESTQAPRRRGEDEEADVIERQRRIQEEIRRKIMGRRPAQGSAPVEPVETPVTARPESVARTPDPAPRRPDPAPRPSKPLGEVGNPYESQIQARLQQIEATKRQAEQLRKQADKVGTAAHSRPHASSHSSLPTPRSLLTKGPLRETLVNPAAARAAFVYAEVLGPPVSQRKSPPSPGLS